jgi:hypothetical protein
MPAKPRAAWVHEVRSQQIIPPELPWTVSSAALTLASALVGRA